MAKDITTITETTTLEDTDVFHVGVDLGGTPTDKRITLVNLKTEVINSSAVDAAGAVMATDFDANTILLATIDNTPVASTATQIRTFLNVEDGADVTDATNVNSAGAVMTTDTSLVGYGFFLDEDNMVSNDATKVASQQSVKAYVDGVTHDAVTVSDSSEIDFTLTGQDITASIVTGSLDVLKLDAGVQASLGLADSAIQSADLATVATTGAYSDLSGTPTLHDAVTVADSSTIDFTLTGQDITASIKSASIDSAMLQAPEQALLSLANTALQDLVDDTTPTLGGNLDAADKNISSLGSVGFTQELDNGSKTASFSVDFGTDQKQKVTLSANTMTLTLDTTFDRVGNYVLKIVNGGLATLTWASESGSIYWVGGAAPTLTSSGTDIVNCYYDGTNWYLASLLGFA